MRIRHILFVSFIFFVSTINVYAEKAYEEQTIITEKCKRYEKIVANKDIEEVYPFFKINDNLEKISKKYINLSPNNKNETVRLYLYKNITNPNEIYKLLLSYINSKENKTIILRENLPKKISEDKVFLTQSVKDENSGYTCYIKKYDNEYWIFTQPTKYKKAIFLIKTLRDTGKLYYYENNINNE